MHTRGRGGGRRSLHGGLDTALVREPESTGSAGHQVRVSMGAAGFAPCPGGEKPSCSPRRTARPPPLPPGSGRWGFRAWRSHSVPILWASSRRSGTCQRPGLGWWLRSKVWVQVGEQVRAALQRLQADPEEWGPPKRVHSILRGPCSHVEMLLPRPRPLWAADGGHCWAPKTHRRRGARSTVL